MSVTEHEFEPTAEPVAALRAAAGRSPALDQEITAAAEQVAAERQEVAANE